jgi:hypothetical protein
MNGKVRLDNNTVKTEKGVRSADVPKRKKLEMQKIIIRVEVEDEKGKKVSGYKEEEWLASVPIDKVLEKTFEAINETE